MIKVSSKELRRVRRLVNSWPRRTKALKKIVAFEAAKRTQALLLEKIPSGKEWELYRNSLEVSEIKTNPDEPSYVLRSRNTMQKVEEIEEDKTLIYVTANRKMKTVRPFVGVLERFSPWTVDTLPSFPRGPDSNVVARKSNQQVVDEVRKRRVKDSRVWRLELSRVGIKTKRPSKGSVPAMVTDVAFSGFKLEFGIGVRPDPHWRPSLREVKDTAPRRIGRNPKIKRLFSDTSFTGWKRWEKIQTGVTVRSSEAQKFVPFQKRLGVKT